MEYFLAQTVDELLKKRHTEKKTAESLCAERRMNMADKKLTIGDVAEQLGVSPSTVSRAISGKGRIGKATREKVLDFVREHDYRPAGSAREVAHSKTNNIAILIPDVRNLTAIPFYYMCMCGVNEVAQARGYDMFVITLAGKDTGRLKSLIDKNKVDGIILGNTHKNDVFARYLKSRQLPFVTIGSLEDETVVQIDHDNRGACRDLTAILLSRKWSRIAYMGQKGSLVVDEERYEGYVQAHLDAGVRVDPVPARMWISYWRNRWTASCVRTMLCAILSCRNSEAGA